MIEERKHGEQNNEHDSRKCENIQNHFCGDIHPQGVTMITSRMP
jgi:hypothetical protein